MKTLAKDGEEFVATRTDLAQASAIADGLREAAERDKRFDGIKVEVRPWRRPGLKHGNLCGWSVWLVRESEATS